MEFKDCNCPFISFRCSSKLTCFLWNVPFKNQINFLSMDGIFSIKDDYLDYSATLSAWWYDLINRNQSCGFLLFRNIKLIIKSELRLELWCLFEWRNWKFCGLSKLDRKTWLYCPQKTFWYDESCWWFSVRKNADRVAHILSGMLFTQQKLQKYFFPLLTLYAEIWTWNFCYWKIIIN